MVVGCVLIKPNVNHLETFLNFFNSHSYISVEWNLEDLADCLIYINDHYNDYIGIAKHSQDSIRKLYNDSEGFVSHFDDIFRPLI